MGHKLRVGLAGTVVVALVALTAGLGTAGAQDGNAALVKQALHASGMDTGQGKAEGIPVGTVITLQNWQNYKQYMPHAMQVLFEGKYPQHITADMKMVIGPTIIDSQPEVWKAATEKYAGKVQIVTNPNGTHYLKDYVTGVPFPNPSGPMKGWQIVANEWYHYVYRLNVSRPFPDVWAGLTFDGSYHQTSGVTFLEQKRWTHLGDANYPLEAPNAAGRIYTEYYESYAPEQIKYTATLISWYNDPFKDQVEFAFIPALRRTLRLSSAARCAPSGSGGTANPDDFRFGYGGGVGIFDADFLRNQKIIAQVHADLDCLRKRDYSGWYMPMVWQKPKCGAFELRDVDVINIHRVPSMSAGYCYSKVIMYADIHSWAPLAFDKYDSAGRFWKGWATPVWAIHVPFEKGLIMGAGNYMTNFADFQNSSWIIETCCIDLDQPKVGTAYYKKYMDPIRYGSPTGLNMVMK